MVVATAAVLCSIAMLNCKRRAAECLVHGGGKELKRNSSKTRVFLSKSSDSNPLQDKETIVASSSSAQEEELRYLWKLGSGCVAGGVVIKYGSVLFPAIPTTPNLTLALIMVSTPMLLSLLLLFRQTYVDQQTKDGSSSLN